MSDRVVFEDRYLDTPSLRSLIRSADVVLLPYDSREQISSGVLVEAIAAGKPVVATAFPHAIEQLAIACGIVVPHEDPESISKALRRLLTDDALAGSMRGQAEREAERLAWPAIGQEYLRLAHRVSGGAGSSGMTLPEPTLRHLQRMTDDTSLFEHAIGSLPHRALGYCTDDAGRGLAVAVRSEDAVAEELAERWLAFLVQAHDGDGRFRLRMGFDRRWTDDPSSDDACGRAIFGIGVAAAIAPWTHIGREARRLFELVAPFRSMLSPSLPMHRAARNGTSR